MTWLLVRAMWLAVLTALACSAVGCSSANTVRGEVRFHRDVDLPEGATVTVLLLDTSYADASAYDVSSSNTVTVAPSGRSTSRWNRTSPRTVLAELQPTALQARAVSTASHIARTSNQVIAPPLCGSAVTSIR